MASHGHATFSSWMLELSVASAASDFLPALSFENLDDLPDFHGRNVAAGCDRSVVFAFWRGRVARGHE